MKTIFATIIGICFVCLSITAQDTIYIYKSGSVAAKQAIADIDSIIFYIPGAAIDIDGNVYNTVTIGDQVWMSENLRTSRYKDNAPIPEVSDSAAWTLLSTGAFCWYNNDSASNEIPYGKLYNWYAVETEKLCPAGWHVANNTEWNTLITFLGGAGVAGGKLKEAGTAHWNYDSGATNSSGFTALPNLRDDVAVFHPEPGKHGLIWTSTSSDDNNAYQVRMDAYDNETENYPAIKKSGYYVRCIKD